MNGTMDTRGALRDLFQFHFGSNAWVLLLFAVVAAAALVILLGKVLSVQPGACNVPPNFRTALAYTAVICWVVSALCAYAGGFVMGRLYAPRA